MKLYDKDIREPLFEFLEGYYGRIRILEEKSLGRSRADAFMVRPAELIGIEIKSDADSYTRLKTQVRDYDKFFDGNIIVVGSTHAAHAGEHVPEHWGIISAETENGTTGFYVVRDYMRNPERDPECKIKILWRRELAHIQEINGMYAYKDKSKDFVRKKILEKVPETLLNEQISGELFERDYNTIAEDIDNYRKEQGRRPKRKRVKRKKLRLL